MAKVEFRNEQDGSVFTPDGAARATGDVRAWAERNGFEEVVFWRDGEKLWVQLGEDKLNYWMPQPVFASARTEDLEMQLDYARGAQRRSAAGYAKFDK